jgi:DNA mismatch repair protein MutS
MKQYWPFQPPQVDRWGLSVDVCHHLDLGPLVQTSSLSVASGSAMTYISIHHLQDVPMATTSAKTKPASKDTLTPAMRQYVDQKKQAGDAILFFRMGDFYEMFYEDAKTAARVLDLTLTSRSKENAVPLAGIPYHALEGYLSKLVRAGYKVAISEQIEDPKQAKGVVQRAIVRIVTPGTLTDDALLEQRADNYLAAYCERQGEGGLAWVDLSTGAFHAQVLTNGDALHELVRIRPSELLVPQVSLDTPNPFAEQFRETVGGTVSNRPAHMFDPYHSEKKLHDHFNVSTLAGFGWGEMNPALCSAGAILDYLHETQKSALPHITAIRPRESDRYVKIDQATWRSLEMDRTLREGRREGSLLGAIDETVNSMGARCLRRWICSPLRTAEEILSRQDAVAELRQDRTRLDQHRHTLRDMSDVERITARLAVQRVSPRDLVSLGATLEKLPQLREQMPQPAAAMLVQLKEAIGGMDDLAKFLKTSLQDDAPFTVREGGIIADGYNAELDRLRKIRTEGHTWLADYQAREARRSGIDSLKVGFNHVFGYYIEITHAHAAKIPPDYVRKQTLKNAERYITDELKTFEDEALTAEQRANDLEYKLFEQIRERTTERIPELQRVAEAVATIDVLCGLAYLAEVRRYVRPQLVDHSCLNITAGRHPVLEQSLAEPFVPNDTILDDRAQRLLLITGPNMAGKSTYIRQVALISLMAQIGSCVPAEAMQWSMIDRVFARVGASDEISRGQSTFMVEMTEAANILNNASVESLVILDEIGRGTSTYDGLSLAWAITEHLANTLKCRSFFATHYHELTELADLLVGVKNYNVAAKEYGEEIVFLHQIVPGGTDKSYGVHVARLAGVPKDVILRSREILRELEANFSKESHSQHLARERTRHDPQLLLFDPPEDPIRQKIRDLDLDQMTPLDAMVWLKTIREDL